MARKNRKLNQKDGFMNIRPIGSLIVLATGLALAYVWLGCRCEAVGKEIQRLEQEKVSLNKQYRNEEFRWMQMKAPSNIERALHGRRIEMDWPRSEQVVHLPATAARPEPPGQGYLAGVERPAFKGPMTHD